MLPVSRDSADSDTPARSIHRLTFQPGEGWAEKAVFLAASEPTRGLEGHRLWGDVSVPPVRPSPSEPIAWPPSLAASLSSFRSESWSEFFVLPGCQLYSTEPQHPISSAYSSDVKVSEKLPGPQPDLQK